MVAFFFLEPGFCFFPLLLFSSSSIFFFLKLPHLRPPSSPPSHLAGGGQAIRRRCTAPLRPISPKTNSKSLCCSSPRPTDPSTSHPSPLFHSHSKASPPFPIHKSIVKTISKFVDLQQLLPFFFQATTKQSSQHLPAGPPLHMRRSAGNPPLHWHRSADSPPSGRSATTPSPNPLLQPACAAPQPDPQRRPRALLSRQSRHLHRRRHHHLQAGCLISPAPTSLRGQQRCFNLSTVGSTLLGRVPPTLLNRTPLDRICPSSGCRRDPTAPTASRAGFTCCSFLHNSSTGKSAGQQHCSLLQPPPQHSSFLSFSTSKQAIFLPPSVPQQRPPPLHLFLNPSPPASNHPGSSLLHLYSKATEQRQ